MGTLKWLPGVFHLTTIDLWGQIILLQGAMFHSIAALFPLDASSTPTTPTVPGAKLSADKARCVVSPTPSLGTPGLNVASSDGH